MLSWPLGRPEIDPRSSPEANDKCITYLHFHQFRRLFLQLYKHTHTHRKAEYVKCLASRNSHTLQFLFTLNVYSLQNVNSSYLKAEKLLHISWTLLINGSELNISFHLGSTSSLQTSAQYLMMCHCFLCHQIAFNPNVKSHDRILFKDSLWMAQMLRLFIDLPLFSKRQWIE